jgi:hypothetical protein
MQSHDSLQGSNLSHSIARFVARDSSTTTSTFVFFIENSSPRRPTLGACFQKNSRAARRFRNYLPDDATPAFSLDSPVAAISDRVCDAMTLGG